MKPDRIVIFLLAFALGGNSLLRGQGMDDEISNLATNLASAIKNQTRKKVAVIDFSDLDGNSSELGKYIAEQLTVDLVMVRHDFSVLDRGNLRKILAEHKLTATGLVDPDNAKKLGQLAGVDAIILGTVTPKKPTVAVTAKIITTDTAEIVGAARAEFPMDNTVQDLVSKPALVAKVDGARGFLQDDKPSVVKSFGDLCVEMRPLLIVSRNQLQMTLTLTNQSPRRSVWVALSGDNMFSVKSLINDSAGAEFRANRMSVSGIQVGTFSQYGYTPNSFSPATEIKPGDTVTGTLRFFSQRNQMPAPGRCRVQLEILQGRNYDSAATGVSFDNFTADVDAAQ